MTYRREYGSKVVGEVTLDQVYGGARGIKSLVWEVRWHLRNDSLSVTYSMVRALFSTLKRVSDLEARL